MRALLPLLMLLALLGGCAGAPASATSATVPSAADQVDYSCRVDSDCAVKDVGNCCGAYPACVNTNSPTFPERVAAECQRQGMSSVCGFPDIAGCACVEGRCESDGSAAGTGDLR
jgi:hypothetical protein